MSKLPLISIVMPVYNAESFLESAIFSILNQTHSNFEFIIIDDKSTDDSLMIIKKFQKKDSRIKLLNGDGKNLVKALNKGIMKSKGKYIARMDSDDISLPKRLESQVKYIEKYNLDICGCYCEYIDEDNNKLKVVKFPRSHEMCFLSLALKVPFVHPSVLIRSNFLSDKNLKYGKNKYKKAEDFDLWIRMSNAGAKFGNINKILFKYRVRNDSLSSINDKNINLDSKNLTNIFLKNNKNKIEKILNKNQVGLNQVEEVIKARLVFKILNFKLFNNLRYLNIKNILYGLLSEFKNF
jgi:glycosyltransferase involved in cell wall biosynthesis